MLYHAKISKGWNSKDYGGKKLKVGRKIISKDLLLGYFVSHLNKKLIKYLATSKP